MRTKMNAGARSSLKKGISPAIAMAALLAGLTTAKAWDQQATDDQMDYELSQRAAQGGVGPNAYAFAPAPRGHVLLHGRRSPRGRIGD
jgi:hypothetical protein